MDSQPEHSESNHSLRVSVLKDELHRLEQALSTYLNQQDELLTQLQGVQINIQKFEGLIDNAKALIEFNSESISYETLPEGTYGSLSSDTSETRHLEQTRNLNANDSRPREYSREYSNRRSNLRDTLSQAVYELLKDTEPSPGEPGQPIHYRDLVRELQNKGIYISGRDPGLTLIAHIHKDPIFFRPKRGEYGLRDWYPSSKRSVGERSSRRSR